MAASKQLPLITHIKNSYVIFDAKGRPVLSTLNAIRKDCIALYIQDSSSPWEEWKKAGWSCEKIDLTINLKYPRQTVGNIDVTYEEESPTLNPTTHGTMV